MLANALGDGFRLTVQPPGPGANVAMGRSYTVTVWAGIYQGRGRRAGQAQERQSTRRLRDEEASGRRRAALRPTGESGKQSFLKYTALRTVNLQTTNCLK